MVLALPELLALAGLVLALGMVVMGDQFTQALFQVTAKGVGWIPWVGKKAANGVHVVGQRVNAVFSSAALRLEGAISKTWHVLATLIEQTGKAIFDATQVAAKALWLVEVKYPLDAISWLAHRGVKAAGIGAKVTTTVVKRTTVIQGVTRAQRARFGKRVARIEARMAAIPILGAGAIALPFPRLGRLERKAKAQGARLSRVEAKLGAKTFTALVAGALTTLGIRWIRCTNFKKASKQVCGMDTDLLNSLLGATLLLTSAISLEQLARELQEPTDLVTEAMRSLVREF